MSRTICDPEVVKGTLKGLNGFEALKQLFWADLNYQRVNKTLSRRGWSETAANAIAEDPLILAAGGHDESFKVIYTRLKSEKLLSGQERPVISQLLRKLPPYALFVFSNEAQNRWHFINIKPDEHSAQKQIFRRITIGPEERLGHRLRTAAERIAMLDLGEDADWIRSLRHPLTVNDIQIRHDQAFNVESLNQQFFKTFAELYHKVVDDIGRLRGFERVAKSFAHVLLNRMLFLYFIQKKGWLDSKQDYLYSRFKPHQDNPNGHSYYSDVLCPLFASLSNPDMKNKGLGAVPFLNGGLFEDKNVPSHSKRFEHSHPQIKNATFKAIFDDLLEKYNFTVMEDTPFSVELAVNPDMLGRIFESLILELEKDPDKDLRRLTGSYYTPRPIVHFMCQEALKEYLVTKLVGNSGSTAELVRAKVDSLMSLPIAEELDREQIEVLIKQFTPSEAKLLREAILNCRVCDPAVGSGAFPVGMLHEMVAVIARLDLRINGSKILERRNYYYDLKKQIVQTCLYGVDIQEQAVRLCELRLWLSLIVDYQIDPNKPFAQAVNNILNLPNLSFRIVRGDSLLERLFGHVVQLDEMAKDAETKQLIGSLQQDKREHFLAGRLAEKRRLELKILTKQAELAEILIEQKKSSMITYQTNLFGEEGMTAKEQKAKAKFEAQLAELTHLRTKVAEAKSELERLTLQKEPLSDSDLETLRSKYFQNGKAPTFMWRVEFAEVFLEKNGFDVIIGNPPYLNARRFQKEKVELAEHYVTPYGSYDIYVVFMELGIRLLNSTGLQCLITSNKYLIADYGSLLRKFLGDRSRLLMIIDLADCTRVFDALVSPAITLASQGVTQDNDKIKIAILKDREFTNIKDVNFGERSLAKLQKNRIAPFDIYIRSGLSLVIDRIEENAVPLSSLGMVRTGIMGFDYWALEPHIHDIPTTSNRNLKRVVTNSHIDHFHFQWGKNIRLYKNDYANPRININCGLINDNTREFFNAQKIIMRGVANHTTAAFDDTGHALLVAVHGFVPENVDAFFIVGLLNSALFDWLHRIRFYSARIPKGSLRYPVSFWQNLPIKSEPEKLATEIATLAKRLVNVNYANLNDLWRQLNKKIVELYEVTEIELRWRNDSSPHRQPMQKAGITRRAKAA